MTTLGDRVKKVWENYLAISTEIADTAPNSKKLEFKPDSYDEELSVQGYKKLNPSKRRKLAQETPLLMKGVRKKCADTFRAWCYLETLTGKTSPASKDLKLISDFEMRSNIKAKFTEARIASHIFGTGFLLITFTKDEETELYDPVSPDSIPWDATIINSEYINKLDYYNKAFEKKGILHYIYNKGSETKYIHPDRIIAIPANKVPGQQLGTSTFDVLRWIIFSKKNVDIATGRILSWFSHGILDIAVEDLDPDEREYYEKTAAQHPGAWVHDTDMKLGIHNPTAIDPKPFYEYLILNIAAALVMPTHVLTGIQTGRVTGSEVGFADYYRDVRDDQDLVISPLLSKLYSRILTTQGREWKYKLGWNTTYIDELAEAEIMLKRVEAADKALNGSKGGQGFVDDEEARKMYNRGQIELDPSKKIEHAPIPQPKPENEPPVNPMKPPKPEKAEKSFLSDEQLAMIQRCKDAKERELQAVADKEKKLGKKILDEQDDVQDTG